MVRADRRELGCACDGGAAHTRDPPSRATLRPVDTTPPAPGQPRRRRHCPSCRCSRCRRRCSSPAPCCPLHIFEPRYQALDARRPRDAPHPLGRPHHGHPRDRRARPPGHRGGGRRRRDHRSRRAARGPLQHPAAGRAPASAWRSARSCRRTARPRRRSSRTSPGEVSAQDHAALISTAASFAGAARPGGGGGGVCSNFEFRLPRDARLRRSSRISAPTTSSSTRRSG